MGQEGRGSTGRQTHKGGQPARKGGAWAPGNVAPPPGRTRLSRSLLPRGSHAAAALPLSLCLNKCPHWGLRSRTDGAIAPGQVPRDNAGGRMGGNWAGGGRSQDPPAVWPCFSPPAPSGPVSSPVKWPLVMSVSEARLRTGEARQAGPSLLPALLPTPAPVSVPLGHLRGVGPGRACDPRARPRPGPEASHLFTGA